jgi:putative hemolysin
MSSFCKYLWLALFPVAALVLELHVRDASAQSPSHTLRHQRLEHRREEEIAAEEADDDDDSDEIALEMQQKQHLVGLPNPASVNCIKNGGVLKEEAKPNGDKFSVCYFSDGGQCEIWALLRRDCQPGGVIVSASDSPAARYCALIGGYFTPGWFVPDQETGTCRMPRVGTVKAQDLWNGKQQLPATSAAP